MSVPVLDKGSYKNVGVH